MRIVIAQMRVGREIARNSEAIRSLLAVARPEDLVVFPEGALTGYFPADPEYLATTAHADVDEALEAVQADVAARQCHCIVGTARPVAGRWRNSAALLSADGNLNWYDKNVLSTLDSRCFTPGDDLRAHEVDGVKVGVQICWELLFPWQWAQLKREGAQVVVHVNNAVKPEDAFWEHILLTRAFENRYFVCTVNNAAHMQALPSALIAPSGSTLLRCEPKVEQAFVCEIDLSDVGPPGRTWSE